MCFSDPFEHLILLYFLLFLLFLLLLPRDLYTANLLAFFVASYSIWGLFWPVDKHYGGGLFVNIHDIEKFYFHSLMVESTIYY